MSDASNARSEPMADISACRAAIQRVATEGNVLKYPRGCVGKLRSVRASEIIAQCCLTLRLHHYSDTSEVSIDEASIKAIQGEASIITVS